MKAPSYWPAVSDAARVGSTPQDLLEQQAALLSGQTNGVLFGDVTASARGERITLDLFIVAPKLNDYSYRLLKVRYNPMRPFDKVEVVVPGSAVQRASGEDDYNRLIADALSSPETASIMGQLLGLSKRASGGPS